MSRKTIEIDSNMIDHSLQELSKLIIRLDKNPKKTRKEQNTIKKIKIALVNTSYNIAWSQSNKDKDYCYDQVGDGHFCFNTKEKCRLDKKK